MKQENLLKTIGQVKEEFIEEAAPKATGENKDGSGNKKSVASTGKFKHSWVRWGALAAWSSARVQKQGYTRFMSKSWSKAV